MMALQLDENGEWLRDIRVVSSPNCDNRPAECNIELLVIHGISLPPGQYGGNYIDQLFTNTLSENDHPYFKEITGLKVSSHILINRTGEITQYVPFNKRAWHAGESEYQGRTVCNDFSIGIELEGVDDCPYERAQYVTLAKITDCLASQWPGIVKDRIVGHSDIAPGRKTDPGPAFDWNYYFSLCKVL